MAKKVRNYLLMNRGDGKFADVSSRCGDGMDVVESSRGAACADFDHDGDLDAVILNSDAQPTLLRNDSQTPNHWLQIRLRQPERNRFAIGARVRVITGQRSQIGLAVSGRGYQSRFGTRLHFGLGRSPRVEAVEVRWPNGTLERFSVAGVDRMIELVAGTGQTQAPPR